MRGLLAAEVRKVSTTRLWWGLLLGALAYTLVQAGVTAAFAGADPGAGQQALPELDDPGMIRTVYASSAFTGAYILALVLGITGMTGEYRHQTITPTFLASPRRERVVAAKAGAHLLFGAGYGLACLLAAFVVGGLVIAARGYPLGLDAPGLWRAAALAVLAVALWTLVGIGIGTLIRSQVAAIMVGVFVTFLLEPLATVGLHAADLDAVAQYLPTNASAALSSPASSTTDYLTWWAGGLVLLGYAAVFTALGLVLTRRRDIS